MFDASLLILQSPVNSTLDLVVKAADAGAVHTPQPAFLVVPVAFDIAWWASLLVENVGWPIFLRLRNCGANQKVLERFRRVNAMMRAVVAPPALHQAN